MYSTLEVIFQVNFTSSANYPPFQTNKNKILKKDTAKVGSGCQKLIASSWNKQNTEHLRNFSALYLNQIAPGLTNLVHLVETVSSFIKHKV